MAEENEKKLDIEDLGGGVQRKTSRFLMRDNESWGAENVSFDNPGAISKKLGYTAQATNLVSASSTSTSTSTTTTSTSTSSSTSTSTSTTTTA